MLKPGDMIIDVKSTFPRMGILIGLRGELADVMWCDDIEPLETVPITRIGPAPGFGMTERILRVSLRLLREYITEIVSRHF